MGVPLVNAQEMSLKAELNSESSRLGSGCLFFSQASMPRGSFGPVRAAQRRTISVITPPRRNSLAPILRPL